MTDEQTLFAVFALFYALECLHWLPLNAVILRTWAVRKGWAAGTPSVHASASGNGLVVAWPLPPLGSLLVAQQWPVIPDLTGLWIGAGQLGEGNRLAWETLAPRQEKRTIHLTTGVKVQCTSERAATLLAGFLRHAATESPDLRQKTIESFWQSSLSLPRARAAVGRYQLAAQALRMPCVTVQFIAFAWIPALFWRFGGSNWRVLAGFSSLLALTTWVAFIWRELDFRLFADFRRKRWAQMLHLVFMPAHAIRAHDLIGVEALAGLHPLAAASVLLPRETLTAFASQTWRIWKFRPGDDALAPAAGTVLPRLADTLQRLGMTVADLEAAPSRQGAAASYCPRCHAQFTTSATICGQCGGIPTRQWVAATDSQGLN